MNDHDKSLAPEDKEHLSEFKLSLKKDRGHIGAYGGPHTSVVTKHYVFSIKPKRTNP